VDAKKDGTRGRDGRGSRRKENNGERRIVEKNEE
jgi:hypothetical protein